MYSARHQWPGETNFANSVFNSMLQSPSWPMWISSSITASNAQQTSGSLSSAAIVYQDKESPKVTIIDGNDPNMAIRVKLQKTKYSDDLDGKNWLLCPGLSLILCKIDGKSYCSVICSKKEGFRLGEFLKFDPTALWPEFCQTETTSNFDIKSSCFTSDLLYGAQIFIRGVKREVEGKLVEKYSEGKFKRRQDSIKFDSNPNKEGFSCNKCGKMFSYSYYRDKHLKYTRCVDNGDRKFPCNLCTRSFEKRDRLRIHILHVHEKYRPHCCNICVKCFSQSSSLNKHLRVHSGERPYKCTFCPKAFTASSILRTHIRQHSGERPFKCKHCGKEFASHAAHDSHIRRNHSLNGIDEYECQTCGKIFNRFSHLKFHSQCFHDQKVTGFINVLEDNHCK